jgi:hypothetical protein
MSACISAIQHLRSLRGGSQAQLIRASQGNCYVTKFQNNPQHIKVLANEMLATRLGLLLGLPMPRVEVIEVSSSLVERTQDLRIRLAATDTACAAGKQLGSRYVGESVFLTDYLPQESMKYVKNISDFARVLVLDKWTCNADGRQAIFTRRSPRSRYWATFIDQGYCFNAGEWSFPDYPLRGVFANNYVYQGVTRWESFEPALTRAEEMSCDGIWRCVAEMPEEWYEGEREALERLVESLLRRRRIIRRLIDIFRESQRNPFPGWKERAYSSGSLQGCGGIAQFDRI